MLLLYQHWVKSGQVHKVLQHQITFSALSYKSLDEALNDVLARILAISAVHDLLSREDLDHVSIRSIAQMLAQHQLQSLIRPTHKLEFDVKGDDIRLNMTQATQVALVLNELIQNAVEHGFEETHEGDIHVTVEDNDGEIGLWVSNNGDPLSESFDLALQSNLGLQIVENLAVFEFSTGAMTLTEAGTRRRASLHVVRGEAAVGIVVRPRQAEDFCHLLGLFTAPGRLFGDLLVVALFEAGDLGWCAWPHVFVRSGLRARPAARRHFVDGRRGPPVLVAARHCRTPRR